MKMIRYRIASDPTDMPAIVDLEVKIWGISERDAFPTVLLSVVGFNGGAVFVAEEANTLVGFCFCSPARRGGDTVLWSYIAGVHPDYQGQGIGRTLKELQRTWAQENGYQTIHWTFDPLQPGNANFNLNELGAVARTYRENVYGEMNDAINALPLATDRLEATWHVNDVLTTTSTSQEDPIFLVKSAGESPEVELSNLSGQVAAIAVSNTRDRLISEWQHAMRRAFQHAFAQQYEAYRFVRHASQSYYLLRPIA